MTGTAGEDRTGIAAVLARMDELLDDLPPELAGSRVFLATYRRTTVAVGDAVRGREFEDPAWVEAWDVAFAQLYLDALAAYRDGRPTPRPWRLAFAAPPGLADLQHVLLGINAHINYDLPQALLAVITPDDFADPEVMERRRADHARIDGVLARRVSAEDAELRPASLRDRLLAPLNRAASRRFLQESRRKVWANVEDLHRARVAGPDAYGRRLAELEVLSAAKIGDLLAPGPVLLRLAVAGFGVRLPPPG